MKEIIYKTEPIDFKCKCWCLFTSDEYKKEKNQTKWQFHSNIKSEYILDEYILIEICPICSNKLIKRIL